MTLMFLVGLFSWMGLFLSPAIAALTGVTINW